MSLSSGTYIITNVKQNRFVYLEDANYNSPLRGHYRPDNRSARWYLTNWGNDEYSIQNVDHDRYANCGPLAGLRTVIEGDSRDQLWRIQARPTGEYTIATIDNGNVWMLAYNEPDTSVSTIPLNKVPRRRWACLTIPQMMQPQSRLKTGIQSMVKNATRNIMVNNSSNTRTGRLLTERATDIAQDLEHSGDPARRVDFLNNPADVAAEFESDDIQSQTDPVSFLKRQNAIMQADAQLDVFKARPPSRDSVMKEAADKDLQKLDLNLHDLCESSLPLIKELCDMLPNRKTLKVAGVSDEILSEKELFSRLQIAMAEFNRKIVALQELGHIDFKMMIVILRLEDPDADPLHLHCGIDETFGELLQKAFLSDQESLPGASQGENGDEADDDPIPDVWVRKFDATHNSVTKTGQWWEHQPETIRIRDVFSISGETSKNEQKQWVVEVVEKKGDYVVCLMKDNDEEMGKVVDLPNSKKRRDTMEHIRKLFPNRQVAKVLELQGGNDASNKMSNKLSYQPKTNKLYVELEPV